jgi:hypothetical protein
MAKTRREEERDKFAEELAKIPGAPEAIKLRVYYDEALQRITKKEYNPVIMSKGSLFAYLLQNVFIEHPEIEKQYPPGKLGFIINKTTLPKPHTPLFDGDVVEISANF